MSLILARMRSANLRPTGPVAPLGLAMALQVLIAAWLLRHLDGFQWDIDEGFFAGLANALLHDGDLYTQVWYDHPPGTAYGLLTVFRLFGPSVEAARGVSLLLTLVGVTAVAAIAYRLRGPWAAAASVPLLMLTPHFYWLVRSVNPDLPSMALGIAALALLWLPPRQARSLGANRVVVGAAPVAGLLFGIALSIKLGVALLVPALGCALVFERRRVAEVLRDGVAFSMGTLVPVAGWFLVAPADALMDGAFGVFAAARAAYPDRTLEYASWLIRENLLGDNLGLVVLAVAGTIGLASRSFRSRRMGSPSTDLLISTAWLGASLIAIVNQRPMWPKHHFSLVLWPLAPLAGAGLVELVSVTTRALLPGKASIALPHPTESLAEPGRHGSLTTPPRSAGTTPSNAAVGKPPPSAISSRATRILALAALAALAAWGTLLPGTVAELRSLRQPDPFSAGWDGVRWLVENTGPNDLVVSDNGLLPFRAGRPTPPELATISSKRIQTGGLLGSDIVDILRTQPVRAVLHWNDQFDDFPAVEAHLATHFERVQRVGGERDIWVRRDIPPVDQPVDAAFPPVGTLQGLSVRPGPNGLQVTLFWQATGHAGRSFSVFLHALDGRGETVGQGDGLPLDGDWTTDRWLAGQSVPDTHVVPLEEGAEVAGLRLGLYDPETLDRLPALKSDGTRWEESAVLIRGPFHRYGESN